ncbi:DUF4174 domain-containing protein [Thioclava indica]|nr:DUF4174 domain-containing protein [Thioclava indica]
MTPRRPFVMTALLALCLGSAGFAQDTPVPATPAATVPVPAPEAGTQDEIGFAPISGADASLDALIWQKRPIVVFADSPFDPAFKDQMRLLEERWPELAARDVMVIADTAPNPPSSVRLKLRPRGFSLVIIAKDGTVNLRKPRPWDAREIIRSIDKMPIRREEIRNGAQQ